MTIRTIFRRNAFAFSERAREIRAASHLLRSDEDPLGHETTAARGRTPVTPTALSSPLRLTLFGGPSLSHFSESLPLSPYQGALLGLLASHGQRGVRRGELLSLLWHNGDDELLRPRLNQLIYSIHRRLHDERMIRLAGDVYLFDEGRVSSDLELFLSALRDRQLSDAIGILGRGFLSGLESSPSAAFERWSQMRELRFRSDLRTLAFDCWRDGEQRADWSMAEEAAEVLLRLDPEDEGALRKLIQARALRGRVREAESTYTEFCELARIDDPEYAPEEETERLFGRLGELGRLQTSMRPNLPIHATYDTLPFVGRTEELGILARAIRNTHSEGAPLFLVTGEGGIGKTRLICEALARAPFDGVRVLAGRCSEFEKGIPLSPILSALAVEWAATAIGELEEPWRATLLHLLPEHRISPNARTASPATRVEDVPRVTCEAFLRFFQNVAGTDPVVLFLDDLQWIDPTSLSVLAYIQERWEGGRLLLLGAVRKGDVVPDSDLAHWIAQCTGARQAHSVSLGPLSRQDLTSLLTNSISGSGGDETERDESLSDLISDVIVFSDGHPLLALECVQSRITEGSEFSISERSLSVPEELKEMVAQRVAQLSNSGRHLVIVLSASEKPVSISVLRDACLLGPDEMVEAIDEVASRHLVTLSPRGAGFQHGLLRNAVYEGLTFGTRIDAHRRIANALVCQGDSPPVQDIALHLLLAGEPDRAIPYVLTAAESLTESGGWSEAKELLTVALDSEPAPDVRPRIAALLGRVSLLLGDLGEAEIRWTDAAKAYRSLGKEEEALAAQLRLLEVQRLRPNCDHDVLLKNTRALRDDAADRNLRKLVAECLDLEIRLLDGLRRFDDVRDLTSGVLNLVDSNDVEAHLQLLFVSAVEAVYGDPEGAGKLADQAAEIAAAHNRPDLLLKALNWKIIALGHTGKLGLPQGCSIVARAIELAKASTSFEQRFSLHANLGVWCIDTGQHEAAARCFGRAEESLGSLAAPSLRRNLLINRGLLALDIGDSNDAREYFESSLRMQGAHEYSPARYSSLAGLGLANIMMGKLSEARRIRDVLPERPRDWTFDPFLWISFESRLSVITARDEGVLGDLEQEEKRLRGTIALAWVRLRLLRFEILLKWKLSPLQKEVRELALFLSDNDLGTRGTELGKLLARHRFPN